MRIAVDLRCITEAQGSGVASYTRRMLAGLHQNTLSNERLQTATWTAFTSGKKKEHVLVPLPMNERHIHWPNRILNLSIVTANFPPADSLLGDVDVFWQPNPLFFPTYSGRHIVTVHDLSFIHFPEFYLRHTRSWYLRWVRQWFERAPKNVTLAAVSNHTRNDIEEIYPQWRGRVIVQPPPPPALATALKRDVNQERLVLIVGTLEPRKNIESLVLVLNELTAQEPGLKVVFVGKSTDWWNRWKRHHTLSPALQWVGYATDDELRGLYSRAWCLIYPSWYEGYGLPPLDASAYGVPVIASSVSSLPELLGGAAVLIDPYRAHEEIGNALVALMRSSALYETYRTRGLNRVKLLTEQYSLTPLLNVWFAHA